MPPDHLARLSRRVKEVPRQGVKKREKGSEKEMGREGGEMLPSFCESGVLPSPLSSSSFYFANVKQDNSK